MNEIQYCDNCGVVIRPNKGIVYGELPFDIESANAGESAIICKKCNETLNSKNPLPDDL